MDKYSETFRMNLNKLYPEFYKVYRNMPITMYDFDVQLCELLGIETPKRNDGVARTQIRIAETLRKQVNDQEERLKEANQSGI